MIKAKLNGEIISMIENKLNNNNMILISYNAKNGKFYISNVNKSEVIENN